MSTVLFDGSAEYSTNLVLVEGKYGFGEIVGAVKLIVTEKSEEGAMEIIGAALGHRIYDGTNRSAMLGVETVG